MKPVYKAAGQLSMFLSLFFSYSKSFSQPPTINFQSVITGLSAPIDIVNAGDGSNRLFIAQQNGIIWIREGSAPFTLSQFMDMGGSTSSGLHLISTGGERGLLSMAFQPGYNGTTIPYFYVYYTDVNGDVAVRRFATMPGPGAPPDPSIVANTAANLLIMTIPHPGQSNHNGGKLNFGPDGLLYFATGDGGGGYDGPNNAQSGDRLLGKMIRIDVRNPIAQTFGNYQIPPGNPYVGDPAILDEVYNLGLRNPFRWSFDRANGNMWIGDVGQDTKEEIDFRPAGSTGHNNFGWHCFEGSIPTPTISPCTPTNNVFPVLDYDNPNPGSSAVTGGYVYRGNEFPNFRGYYIATDFYSGTLYFLWPNGSGGFNSATQTINTKTFISAFGEAEDGTLYAASQADNTVYKLIATAGAPLPVTLSSFSVKHFSGYNELKWATATEQNTAHFFIEYSVDANHFNRVGQVNASRNANGSSYVYQHQITNSNTVYYKLAIQDDDGSIRYSSIVRIDGNADGLKIYPTVVKDGIINLVLPSSAKGIELINTNGAIVFKKALKNSLGTTPVILPPLPKGMYVVQVTAETRVKKEKIIIE